MYKRQGNALTRGTIGSPIVIITDIENLGISDQRVLWIIQVKDESGIVVYITFTNGVIPAGSNFQFGASWTPIEAGTYTVEVFAWHSWSDPTPLSEKKVGTITITNG